MPAEKRMVAPGAIVCTMSAIACPSDPLPGEQLAGMAAAGSAPAPSEMTPTVTPVPSTPVARATPARRAASAVVRSRAGRTGWTMRTPSTAASEASFPVGIQPSMRSRAVCRRSRPWRSSSARRPGVASSTWTRMWTWPSSSQRWVEGTRFDEAWLERGVIMRRSWASRRDSTGLSVPRGTAGGTAVAAVKAAAAAGTGRARRRSTAVVAGLRWGGRNQDTVAPRRGTGGNRDWLTLVPCLATFLGASPCSAEPLRVGQPSLLVAPSPGARSWGLFVGYFFFETGWGKLHDLDAFAERFAGWGIPYPAFNAALSACTECIGGAFTIVGLFTRLVSIPMMINMVVAIVSVRLKTVGSLDEFVELDEPLYLLCFLWLMIVGAGRVSVDSLLKRAYSG